MVAEVVPERRRVEAGALLYTASPFGLFLATFVTYQVTGVYFTDAASSWRYVFLFGLIPAAVAFFVRLFIKEPERWKKLAHHERAKISELFTPKYRALTISGFCMAVTALIGVHVGLKTGGGAEGVGKSSIRAFVLSASMVLILDYILWTIIF